MAVTTLATPSLETMLCTTGMCGTKTQKTFSLLFDSARCQMSDTAAVASVEEIDKIIFGQEFDMFTSSGNRNIQAVDLSIHLWCLGYDPIKWWDEEFLNTVETSQAFFERDLDAFRHHLLRVSDYLDQWGEMGTDEAKRFLL